MKKSFMVVFVLIAALMAAIPAALAGGPSDGIDEYLGIQINANNKKLVRNANDYKYHCRPGDVLNFSPIFLGYDKSGEVIVTPPVQPFSWEIGVGPKTTGVVAPYRSRNKQGLIAKRNGFIYVSAHADSEVPNVEFTRIASETIVVSDKPATDFRAELSFASYGAHDGLAIMRIYTNMPLTNGHLYVYSYGGRAYCSLTCDQGSCGSGLTLDPGVSWAYKPGTTSAVYTWLENGVLKSTTTPLSDGVMDNQGVDLPMTIPVTGSSNGFRIQVGILHSKS